MTDARRVANIYDGHTLISLEPIKGNASRRGPVALFLRDAARVMIDERLYRLTL